MITALNTKRFIECDQSSLNGNDIYGKHSCKPTTSKRLQTD